MASSTMRLSGLISGMDTESIIQQLVSAKQTKVDDAKKAQTKQEWKQTAWKELNTKIKNLQSKFVNNMRFESAYSKRVTKVSDSNAVSVITGDGAMTGVQNLKVSQLAKTAYMTGGKLTLKDNVTADTKLNALTKLSDLGIKGSDGSTVVLRQYRLSPPHRTARRGVRYVAGFVADPSRRAIQHGHALRRTAAHQQYPAQRRLLFFPSGLHRLPGRHDTAPRTGTAAHAGQADRSGSGITTVHDR